MVSRTQIAIVLLALASSLYPALVERFRAVRILFNNAPGKLVEVDHFASSTVQFENVVRNCEDALIVPAHKFAILSCDPGRDRWNTVMGTFLTPNITGGLYHYDYTAGVNQGLFPIALEQYDRSAIHPLGVELHEPTNTLFVVNHGAEGSTIEVFQYHPDQHRAVHQRTVAHALLGAPNSLVALSESELYVTNDHHFTAAYSYPLALTETLLGLPGGSVTHVNLATDEFRTVARVAFANGIALLNATTLAVASTALPGVHVYAVNATSKALTLRQTLRADFFTDNLSVDGDGRLLIAGHPFPPTLTTVAEENHKYDLDGRGEGLDAKDRPRAPSAVVEWNGNAEGVLRTLYVGNEFGTATTAVRDVNEKIGILVGLYEKGILVWRE